MISYLAVPGRVVIVNKGEHPRAWQEQRDLDIPPHDCFSSHLFRVPRFPSVRPMPDDTSSNRKPRASSASLSRNGARTPATENAVQCHGTPLMHTYRQPKPYCRGWPNTATITLAVVRLAVATCWQHTELDYTHALKGARFRRNGWVNWKKQ